MLIFHLMFSSASYCWYYTICKKLDVFSSVSDGWAGGKCFFLIFKHTGCLTQAFLLIKYLQDTLSVTNQISS